MSNTTETSSGWKMFSVAWPGKIYRKINAVARKEKRSKAAFIREAVVEKLVKEYAFKE